MTEKQYVDCKECQRIYEHDIDILSVEVSYLQKLISMAVNRLSMPIKQIKGDGFMELMKDLRAVNEDD